MSNTLIDVIAAVIALIAVIGMVGLLGGSAYDRIGAGGMAIGGQDDELPEGHELTQRELRDEEIEQMLIARSERLARMGKAPLDIEAELARLREGGEVSWSGEPPAHQRSEAHSHDPELVKELHQLAEARNERRLRRGEQPLDVQAEVQRRLAELDD
ncbi:MAG TPA: hypothetical protein VGF95_14050 [Solirubrobacteraceae bacterium]